MPRTTKRCLLATVGALAASLTLPASSRAATLIDGGEVGGQVWTEAGSPYQVRSAGRDLTVAAGTTLRIEAGTEVHFSDPPCPEGPSECWLSLVPLRVAGTLEVNGTAAAPVVLQGEPGSTGLVWGGIAGLSTSVLNIRDAVIRNARYGVEFRAPSRSSVDRTTFENCDMGLRVGGASETAGTHYVFDSIVARNNRWGIEATYGAIVTVTNALLQGNTNFGLIAYRASATVINSTVDGNRYGVAGWNEFWWPLGAGAVTPTISIENTIFSKNHRAIDLDELGQADDPWAPVTMTVAYSTFWENDVNASSRISGSQGGHTVVAAADAPSGVGNAVADPKFRSASDLHLAEGSPCIDSGSAQRAPARDLDQVARPYGPGVDRGAYEHVPLAGTGGAGDGSSGEAGDGSSGEAGDGSPGEAGDGGMGSAVGGTAGGTLPTGGAGGSLSSTGGNRTGGAVSDGTGGGTGGVAVGGSGTGEAGGRGPSGISGNAGDSTTEPPADRYVKGCTCSTPRSGANSAGFGAGLAIGLGLWARRRRVRR